MVLTAIAPFTFDPRLGKTGMYRGPDGRIISERQVISEFENVLRGVRGEMMELTQSLQAGEIGLQTWYDGMRARVKLVNGLGAVLSKGGYAQMTFSDWGRVGAYTKKHYQWLNKFAAHLQAGNLAVDGRSIQRAGMYSWSGRGMFWRLKDFAAQVLGHTQERRMLNPAEHCGCCIEQAALEWQPIGTLAPIGECDCLGNCRCTKEYK